MISEGPHFPATQSSVPEHTSIPGSMWPRWLTIPMTCALYLQLSTMPIHTHNSTSQREFKKPLGWWVLLNMYYWIRNKYNNKYDELENSGLLTCRGSVWLGAQTSLILFLSISSLTSRKTAEGIEIIVTSTHMHMMVLFMNLLVTIEDIFLGNTKTTILCILISVIKKMEAYMLELHR